MPHPSFVVLPVCLDIFAQTKKRSKIQRQVLSQNYYARVENWLSKQLDNVQTTGQLINPPHPPPENPENIISFRPNVQPHKFLGSPRVSGQRYVHELERVWKAMHEQQMRMPAQMPYRPPQANEMRTREKSKELTEAFKYTHRTEQERVNKVIESHNLTGDDGAWTQPTFPKYRPKPDPLLHMDPQQTFRNTFVNLSTRDKGQVMDPNTDMSSVGASDRWFGPLRFNEMMRYPLDQNKVGGRPTYRTGVKLRMMYQSMAPDLRPQSPVNYDKSYWNATRTIAHCNYTNTAPSAVKFQGHTIFDSYSKSFPDKTQTARELTRLLP